MKFWKASRTVWIWSSKGIDACSCLELQGETNAEVLTLGDSQKPKVALPHRRQGRQTDPLGHPSWHGASLCNLKGFCTFQRFFVDSLLTDFLFVSFSAVELGRQSQVPIGWTRYTDTLIRMAIFPSAQDFRHHPETRKFTDEKVGLRGFRDSGGESGEAALQPSLKQFGAFIVIVC